jgi:hypothetical protein
VHGVAAEVAQEVVVFLQDDNLDAGAGEQEGVHEPGGTPTGYADLGSQSGHALTLPAGARYL